jgi:hypothetical protein
MAAIPQSTLYPLINSLIESLTGCAPNELHWLAAHGIETADTYNLADVRASLSDIFTYRGMKTFGGIDIDAIALRLNSRRKSLFAKIHGLYRTIGFADVRVVSPYLIPVFSSNFRSSDSEAMNMMEIVNHAKSVLGEEFKFCTGNAHTVSRVAAGLAFAGHKVILLE